MQSISREDLVMKDAFGTLLPKIAEYPHLIFEADRNIYYVLSELAESTWAPLWWSPVYKADGTLVIHENECNSPKDYYLWGSKENQEWLLERLHPYDSFVVRIPVNTTPEIIDSVRRKFCFDKLEEYIDIFDYVPDCVEELKYIWCQFHDEIFPNDILVASTQQKEFIDKLSQNIVSSNKKCSSLKQKGENFTWPF